MAFICFAIPARWPGDLATACAVACLGQEPTEGGEGQGRRVQGRGGEFWSRESLKTALGGQESAAWISFFLLLFFCPLFFICAIPFCFAAQHHDGPSVCCSRRRFGGQFGHSTRLLHLTAPLLDGHAAQFFLFSFFFFFSADGSLRCGEACSIGFACSAGLGSSFALLPCGMQHRSLHAVGFFSVNGRSAAVTAMQQRTLFQFFPL